MRIRRRKPGADRRASALRSAHSPAAFHFKLAEDLDTDDLARLERESRVPSLIIEDRILVVDMSFVTGIDEAAPRNYASWSNRY